MASSDTDPVLVSSQGEIAVVTLNRPQVLNALDNAMRDRFIAVMGDLNADAQVRGVVLTGQGERAFSAGQDLETARGFTADNIAEHFRVLGGLYQSVRALDKPCVVALNGIAAGFGLQVALHADVRVAHPDVRMSQPEVAAGIPSVMGLWIIKEAVGLARAVEMSLTCRQVPAAECLEWGLVDHVVPREGVMAKALEIARDLASKPTLALRLSKQRMRELTQPEDDATVAAAMRIQPEAFRSGEPQRVAEAFLARRRPKPDA